MLPVELRENPDFVKTRLFPGDRIVPARFKFPILLYPEMCFDTIILTVYHGKITCRLSPIGLDLITF